MKIQPFLLERYQSRFENEVELNLSESGVEPLRVRELCALDPASEPLDEVLLGYPQTNGTRELRETIARLYPGTGPDHVQVTSGGSEANFISCMRLVEPGDEVVLMLPNYMQTAGLTRAFGARVHEWHLELDVAAGRWRPDLERLESLVGPGTKLVMLCNPNNPTGSCLTADELDAVCRVASRHGAWVHSDEIYRGAELEGDETPSVHGRYERTIVTSGLSKAYGLPGLRIGWIVAPPAEIEGFWSYHDYTTIAPAALSDRLARVALGERTRPRILERTRAILRRNLALVSDWVAAQGEGISCALPQAGAMLYLRYAQAIGSTALAERLRQERSVLVVPGDHYGMDGHLRIGFGGEPDALGRGLGHLADMLRSLVEERA